MLYLTYIYFFNLFLGWQDSCESMWRPDAAGQFTRACCCQVFNRKHWALWASYRKTGFLLQSPATVYRSFGHWNSGVCQLGVYIYLYWELLFINWNFDLCFYNEYSIKLCMFCSLSSLDVYNLKEDAAVFTGKRALISFLSWLDYCDQLIKEAHKVLLTFPPLLSDCSFHFFFLIDMCRSKKNEQTFFLYHSQRLQWWQKQWGKDSLCLWWSHNWCRRKHLILFCFLFIVFMLSFFWVPLPVMLMLVCLCCAQFRGGHSDFHSAAQQDYQAGDIRGSAAGNGLFLAGRGEGSRESWDCC